MKTPASFVKNLDQWRKVLPVLLEENEEKSVGELNRMMDTKSPFPEKANSKPRDFPMRVNIRGDQRQEGFAVEASILPGRDLWLWSMKRQLSTVIDVLYRH